MFAQAGIAIITFLLTNIDDLLILSVYFANREYRTRNIVIGQYVGIATLIIISLLGLVLGELVPERWVSLLGIFPIFLGIKELLSQNKSKSGGNDDETIQQRSNFQFVNVALVTIANGGDNIGVYTTLFATAEREHIPLYIMIFFILTGFWCLLSYYLVAHPLVKTVFSRFGKRMLPFFLILLGLFILKDLFG
jgi:cadmium resistance protein CadD (predicted permease)